MFRRNGLQHRFIGMAFNKARERRGIGKRLAEKHGQGNTAKLHNITRRDFGEERA